MVQKISSMTAVQIKLLCAKKQIETELSESGQFGHFAIQTDVVITAKADGKTKSKTGKEEMKKGETVDLVVHKKDIAEIYLIRPVFYSKGELYKFLNKQMERIVCICGDICGKESCCGSESFLYISPCMADYSEILVYWCNGDGIIYFQFVKKANLHYLTKLFVSNVNTMYIQHFLNRKYT